MKMDPYQVDLPQILYMFLMTFQGKFQISCVVRNNYVKVTPISNQHIWFRNKKIRIYPVNSAIHRSSMIFLSLKSNVDF